LAGMQVGLELLFLGIVNVFAVLIVLMAVIDLLAALTKPRKASVTETGGEVTPEEIAVIAAIMAKVAPGRTITEIRELGAFDGQYGMGE
jgi:hypothetical protein